MELLTVFWVNAAGTWTLRKVFFSKVRITHLSSHVANMCYGLSCPTRDPNVIQFTPFYMLALIHLHFCHSISKVHLLQSIESQLHKSKSRAVRSIPTPWQTVMVTNRLPSGWPQLWEAASQVCFPAAMFTMQRPAGDNASTPCAAGHVLSHPTVSQKTTCGLNPALGQDFSSPSCVNTMPFTLLSLPQYTVPAHIPLPTLFVTTCLWDGMNYAFPDENMDT